MNVASIRVGVQPRGIQYLHYAQRKDDETSSETRIICVHIHVYVPETTVPTVSIPKLQYAYCMFRDSRDDNSHEVIEFPAKF